MLFTMPCPALPTPTPPQLPPLSLLPASPPLNLISPPPVLIFHLAYPSVPFFIHSVHVHSVDALQSLPLHCLHPFSPILRPLQCVLVLPQLLDPTTSYFISCSCLFMGSLILVFVHPGGSCPPGWCGLASPRMLASGQDPVSNANRVRFRLK